MHANWHANHFTILQYTKSNEAFFPTSYNTTWSKLKFI